MPKAGRDRAPWQTPGYRAAVRALKAEPDTSCVWCGAIATTIDHAIPVALGGGDADLVPSCWPCNAKRGSDLGHALKRARRLASARDGSRFLGSTMQDPPAFRKNLPGIDPARDAPPSRVW